uniref:Uncharacterized protein n=1 Tax=Nelumbo nucifera TaxID=4432 RepID=A0A822ZV66_NELNU|nr:TPA_asm: hypothetical protein HUJ06_004018 [Nelumbo nucifera]
MWTASTIIYEHYSCFHSLGILLEVFNVQIKKRSKLSLELNEILEALLFSYGRDETQPWHITKDCKTVYLGDSVTLPLIFFVASFSSCDSISALVHELLPP